MGIVAFHYDNDDERRLHTNAIHDLADRYHLDEALIREIYEDKLEALMDGARVRQYLSVLTTRYVKDFLSHHQTFSAEPGFQRYLH